MTVHIRPMRPGDVPYLPAIEQSAGELFRALTDLAWIANDDNLSEGRYRELLSCKVCWVTESNDGDLLAFLSAEMAGDNLHIWEMAVLRGQQRQGIGRALLTQATAFAREQSARDNPLHLSRRAMECANVS